MEQNINWKKKKDKYQNASHDTEKYKNKQENDNSWIYCGPFHTDVL